MSALAKSAREKMKAKARSLASESSQKVDSSDWTPAEPLNADVKTGARPISKRQFKKGGKVVGKVAGKPSAVRADRKRRKSGGKVEAKEETNSYVNRDVRSANEEREGKKHVGGFKAGGKAKRADGGGVKDKQALGKIDPSPKRKAAQHYKAGGKAKKADGGFLENIGNALAGKGYVDGSTWLPKDSDKSEDATSSIPERASRPSEAPVKRSEPRRAPRRMVAKADTGVQSDESPDRGLGIAGMRVPGSAPMLPASFEDRGPNGYRKGGKAKKSEGGEAMTPKKEEDARLGMVKPRLLTFGQNTVVPGQKHGGKVKRAAEGSKKQGHAVKRMNRATGGMVDIGSMKSPSKAKKGKTNINIVINAGKRDQDMPLGDAAMMPPPPPQGVPIPMPTAGGSQGAAPQMPPMGAMPMGMPPAPPAPPPMAPPPMQQMPAPRKSGGRVGKQVGGPMMGFQGGMMPQAGGPAPVPFQMMQAPRTLAGNMPRGGVPSAPMLPPQGNMGGAEQALRSMPIAPQRSYGDIAGPGISPVRNLEIAPSATTYPTKQLLTPEQMAQIPTQSISLNEALRLFLPAQVAGQRAAELSRQPVSQDMTAAERAAEQARRVQQVQADEARRAAEAKAAAERAAAEKAAAERAAAEKAAAERAKAAAAAPAPAPAKSPAVVVAENLAWQNLYRAMYSDRRLKTGVGRKSGGKVK